MATSAAAREMTARWRSVLHLRRRRVREHYGEDRSFEPVVLATLRGRPSPGLSAAV